MVEHHGLTKQLANLSNPFVLLNNVALWHSLGVIGAVIYLLGAECTSCSQPKETSVAEEAAKAAEAGAPKRKTPEKAETKDKKKK
jgi:hypothetical protein